MDKEAFLKLVDKIQNGVATPDEKLAVLKEVNISAAEFNQTLKDLLEKAKEIE